MKKTPFNTKRGQTNLLIGCSNFTEFSGMPMYLINLSRTLIEDYKYSVTISAPQVGGEVTEIARSLGVAVCRFDELDGEEDFDLMLLNEYISKKLLHKFDDIPAWNYLHSKLEYDKPIEKRPQIRGYLAPRKQVSEYWHEKTGYDIDIIPIPIDLDRFSEIRIPKVNKMYNILAVCTLDKLRKPMLLNLVERAKKDDKIRVRIIGKDYGALKGVALPDNVEVLPPTYEIPQHIAGCDEMAGIYIGTVTLEAWAMGKKCSVYDEDGNYEILEKPEGFEQTYGDRSVARRFHKLFHEKWADIIIPHYNQRKLLSKTLESIPMKNYNVVVARGGSFAQNCNKGALAAQTDKLIFANDDLVINADVLWELVDSDKDIIGVGQFYPNGKPLCLGIKLDEDYKYYTTNKRSEAIYPSGAFFKINKSTFNKLGGFDETFRNGGEDQDLFLRALQKGIEVDFAEGFVIHHCSQSKGRFDHLEFNDKYFYTKWPKSKLRKYIKCT